MTTTERAARNGHVVRDRARGMSWPSIAAKYELTERQCRRIVSEFRESEPSLCETDPVEAVEDMLHAYDAAISELVELADRTRNDSVALGAIRERLRAVESKFTLMRAVGVLPHDLHGLPVQLEALEVGRLIVDVLDRNDVAEPVMDEILAVVEGGSPTGRDAPVTGAGEAPSPS